MSYLHEQTFISKANPQFASWYSLVNFHIPPSSLKSNQNKTFLWMNEVDIMNAENTYFNVKIEVS